MFALLTQRNWRGRSYLMSPALDFFFAGGVGWLLMPLLFVLFPLNASGQVDYSQLFYVTSLFAVLAYVVNHPHFMVSYQLMYGDYRSKITAHRGTPTVYWRYIIAGIIVPIALLGYLAYAFFAQNQAIFAIGVQIMFFTVGWHYVKQAFGVFIMLSALKKVYYSPAMRRLLLLNCFLVWMLSWVQGNIWVPGYEPADGNFHGVIYRSMELYVPPMIVQILRWFVIGYGIIALIAIMAQAVRTRTMPSFTALAGYSTMYSFLLLAYYHPLWVYMTPLWHSAQYLLFVSAYKRGEAQSMIDDGVIDTLESRASIKRFVLMAFFLGLLMFGGIPRSLNWLSSDTAHTFGLLLPFIYAFEIFINVHHYFIDNVIWRKENKKVGQYVFYQRKHVA